MRAAAAVILCSAMLSCLRLSADNGRISPSYRYLLAAGNRVFLTFDAHPCGQTLRSKCDEAQAMEGARELLSTLRENDVQSTFFLTGEFIERYPEMVRTILADGHEIGSHLKTHTHPLELESRGVRFSREWFQEELLSADRALVQAAGVHTVKLFRMPYGLGTYALIPGTRRILAWSHELGYTHVDWAVDTFDWVSKSGGNEIVPAYLTPQQMQESILRQAGRGPVVLSHLTRYRPPAEGSVNEALPDLVTRLRARGLETARISDFLPGTEAAADSLHSPAVEAASSTESGAMCSYVWNFKRLHVCVAGLRGDCSTLESSFLVREDACACTPASAGYRVENLGEVVQVTCRL